MSHALAPSLPRTAAALRDVRRNTSRARVPPWLRALRRLWAIAERLSATTATCDGCGGSMLEHASIGRQRLCIRCVRVRGAPVAAAEFAGAAAVVRTLLREAQLDWRQRQSHPFDDLRRNEAILDTVQGVLWWMTPPNVRTPNVAELDEAVVVELLQRFDRMWALRSSPDTLTVVYTRWRQWQAKAVRHAELDEIDRRYAAAVRADAHEVA